MTYNVFSGTLNPAQSKLSAHASPQPKRHLNRFNHLCTDVCGVSLLFTMVCLFPPQNGPFPCWHLDLMKYVVDWAHPGPERKW